MIRCNPEFYRWLCQLVIMSVGLWLLAFLCDNCQRIKLQSHNIVWYSSGRGLGSSWMSHKSSDICDHDLISMVTARGYCSLAAIPQFFLHNRTLGVNGTINEYHKTNLHILSWPQKNRACSQVYKQVDIGSPFCTHSSNVSVSFNIYIYIYRHSKGRH